MNMDPYVKILWFDSLEAQLNAVLAGQGIGLLPDWLVDQIEPVNTISLLSERIPSGLSYWIVMRKESSSDPSIRTLKKWIHGCLISE